MLDFAGGGVVHLLGTDSVVAWPSVFLYNTMASIFHI